jgi:hypothetical protein
VRIAGLPPADVSFEDERADAYCELNGKIDELIGSAIGNGPSAAAVKKLVAPDAIRADVDKLAEFDRKR